MGTPDQKRRILDNFRNKISLIIAATSALGLGLDLPNIRVVFHVGPLPNLRNYSQESGRGGRNGEKSEAIIIYHPRLSRTNDSDMKDYVTIEQCRRIILDLLMDGSNTRQKCGDNEEKCDICSGLSEKDQLRTDINEYLDLSGPPSIDLLEFEQQQAQNAALKDRYLLENRQSELNLENLEATVNYWDIHCPNCELRLDLLDYSPSDHKLAHCKADNQMDVLIFIRNQKDRFRSRDMDEFSGCYKCLLPKDFCTRFDPLPFDKGHRLNGKNKCLYPQGTVFEVIFTYIYHRQGQPDFTSSIKNFWDQRKYSFTKETVKLNDIITYLRSRRVYGDQEINGFIEMLTYNLVLVQWNDRGSE